MLGFFSVVVLSDSNILVGSEFQFVFYEKGMSNYLKFDSELKDFFLTSRSSKLCAREANLKGVTRPKFQISTHKSF